MNETCLHLAIHPTQTQASQRPARTAEELNDLNKGITTG